MKRRGRLERSISRNAFSVLQITCQMLRAKKLKGPRSPEGPATDTARGEAPGTSSPRAPRTAHSRASSSTPGHCSPTSIDPAPGVFIVGSDLSLAVRQGFTRLCFTPTCWHFPLHSVPGTMSEWRERRLSRGPPTPKQKETKRPGPLHHPWTKATSRPRPQARSLICALRVWSPAAAGEQNGWKTDSGLVSAAFTNSEQRTCPSCAMVSTP